MTVNSWLTAQPVHASAPTGDGGTSLAWVDHHPQLFPELGGDRNNTNGDLELCARARCAMGMQ